MRLAPPLTIIADENIPHVEAAFGALGSVHRLPGRAIGPDDVRAADILLVRSVTPVGPALLDDSTVRFVGSATIGTDHIDHRYLRERDIAFAHAPGSNADSVVEYVTAALLRLAAERDTALRGLRLGIVGCGSIGGRLIRRMPALGLELLTNDPPLQRAAERDGVPHAFLPLDDVLRHADILTVHVPLTRTGRDATVHLLGEPELRRMQPEAWLVNAARGPVVDNAALLRVLRDDHLGAVVLDVWEHEPHPDPDLLERVDLATPHIAGYSFDGKAAGTIMLYHALAERLDAHVDWDPEAVLAPTAADRLTLAPPDPALPEHRWLDALVRQAYPIAEDDARMRALLGLSAEDRGPAFVHLRRDYPRRRAFDRFTVDADAVPAATRTAVADGLRMRMAGE